MGYESKFYIVRKLRHQIPNDEGMIYAEVIAMVDMAKCYPLSSIFNTFPKTKCYFYADDGNTRIIEDRYGSALPEASIPATINVLEAVMHTSTTPYWRYNFLLAILKEVEKQISPTDDFAVLHFGH